MQVQPQPSKAAIKEQSCVSSGQFWMILPDFKHRAERTMGLCGGSFICPIHWALPPLWDLKKLGGWAAPRRVKFSLRLVHENVSLSYWSPISLHSLLVLRGVVPYTAPFAALPRPFQAGQDPVPLHMPHLLLNDPEVNVANLLWSLGLLEFCCCSRAMENSNNFLHSQAPGSPGSVIISQSLPSDSGSPSLWAGKIITMALFSPQSDLCCHFPCFAWIFSTGYYLGEILLI
jgi:hypothetical protein